MKRTLAHLTAVAALAGLMASGSAFAEQAPGATAAEGANNPVAARMLARFDANGDGQITRSEAKARLVERFVRMDVDKDGIVTRAERQEHRFAKMDTNGDGLISRPEMEALTVARAETRFVRLDTDGDGAISLSELRAGKGWRGRGGKGRTGPMTLQDLDARVMRMFDRADRNKDGVITSDEAKLMHRHGRRS